MHLSLGPDKAPFDQRRLVLKSAFVHKELRMWVREGGGCSAMGEVGGNGLERNAIKGDRL